MVTPNNSYAAITPGDTSCLKSQYCSFVFQGVGVNEEIVTMPNEGLLSTDLPMWKECEEPGEGRDAIKHLLDDAAMHFMPS